MSNKNSVDKHYLSFENLSFNYKRDDENIVYSIIENFSKNNIVVFITHKISLLKKAKKIIVLDKGCIVQSCNYSELARINGVFKNILSKNNRTRRKE